MTRWLMVEMHTTEEKKVKFWGLWAMTRREGMNGLEHGQKENGEWERDWTRQRVEEWRCKLDHFKPSCARNLLQCWHRSWNWNQMEQLDCSSFYFSPVQRTMPKVSLDHFNNKAHSSGIMLSWGWSAVNVNMKVHLGCNLVAIPRYREKP